MIKKLAALALALLMTLSMAACGSQKDDQAGGAVTPGVTGDAVPDMGTVSGGTYTNRFAGISCTLDDSWYFYTDEQIDELNGFVRESTSDEELKARLESSSSVQDMYAASTDGLMTINVVFTNMGLLGGSTVTPQDVAELSVEQVPAALESYGFTDVTAQLTTVDFAGQKNVPAVAVSAMNGDIATYELLVCLKAGNYSFSVTLCSFTEDVTADMAALFTAALVRVVPMEEAVSHYLVQQVADIAGLDFSSTLALSVVCAWVVFLGFFLAVAASRKNLARAERPCYNKRKRSGPR